MIAITEFFDLDRHGCIVVLPVSTSPFNSRSCVLLNQGMHTIDCHHA
jgi:hypothetical protein